MAPVQAPDLKANMRVQTDKEVDECVIQMTTKEFLNSDYTTVNIMLQALARKICSLQEKVNRLHWHDEGIF